MKIHRIGYALFDGCNVVGLEERHASTVLGGPEAVEVTCEGRENAISVGGEGVERHGADLGPLRAELGFADIVVEQVAVLHKAAAAMGIGVAVDGGESQGLLAQRYRPIIAGNHKERDNNNNGTNHDDNGQREPSEHGRLDAAPKRCKHNDSEDAQDGKCRKRPDFDEDGNKRNKDYKKQPREPVAEKSASFSPCFFSHSAKITPIKEPERQRYCQADIERETNMGNERDDIAVWDARHGEETHVPYDCGDEDRGDEDEEKHL